jgi:nicotinic acid mononucleotide adenylyltransferase/nicotinamide mononucleotide (NMN) deamidase PncC
MSAAPMNPSLRRLIEALHAGPYRYVIAATGGGTSAVAALLSVPGGSRTVLEALVPYHERALFDFLGRAPDQACSADTARAMAERACDRARWLAPGEAVAGAACTASLATDRPKRGDHRFHVAVHTTGQTLVRSLTLTKGARDRAGEETVLDAVLLNALAEAFGLTERVDVPLLPGEEVWDETVVATGALAALFRGEINAACVESDGRVRTGAPTPALLLPGAFNPIHAGHWGLADAAAKLTGSSAAFELSVTNVDKPPLGPGEVRRRLAQFAWRAPIWLVRAPTFVEKARLLPGATFVVGADTAERVVAQRYYHDSSEEMARAFHEIHGHGCRFLVAGRVCADGRFAELHHLNIPEAHRDLFAAIPAEAFRVDVSSTALRAECRAVSGLSPATKPG